MKPDPHFDLAKAVQAFYDIAVVRRKTQSPQRLAVLASACIAGLENRGLRDAEAEVTIPAGGRDKDWDVAWKWAGKYRMVISLKSILRNLAGTVPNRIDDAMGETASIQLYSPEVVTGYVVLVDAQADSFSTKHGMTWVDVLRSKLAKLSGRRAPYWSPGTFEAYSVVTVDFTDGPTIQSGADDFERMLDALASETKVRNPGIEETQAS